MEKKIRSDLLKMIAIMVGLVGIGIYARDFVIEGIMAKAALNLSIFALFGVAAGISFKHVLGLKNEILAMKALKIDYGSQEQRPSDPYKTPAIVFKEPQLLGQGYRMIAEEMGKQETLKISDASAQLILHDVDMRINDRKSTLMYFSGLMVFLGLLGAFMGLMKTVSSVSDLIGSMDLNGGADSFGKMIEGMKAPLNGMSVGFSSSLFGLLTSMVLGALERFMTGSMKVVRNEFEHWLANVSSLETNASEGAGQGQGSSAGIVRALELGGRHLRDLRETILDSAMVGQETNRAVMGLAQSIQVLNGSLARIYDPEPLLKPITACVADLAHNQTVLVQQFRTLHEQAAEDRRFIRETLSQMRAQQGAVQAIDPERLHGQLEHIGTLNAQLLEVGLATNARSLSENARTGWLGSFTRWILRIGDDRAVAKARRELLRDIRHMNAAQRRLVKKVDATLGDGMERMGQERTVNARQLAQLAGTTEANSEILAELSRRLSSIEQVTGHDDSSASPAASLYGARLELAVLRQRLQAAQDDGGPQTDAYRVVPEPERLRANDGGRSV
ncbi:hypothetical protein [Novosphingobium sp. AAP83]|uniref:hypothetical protein n=1 Tax=Novosphingobium sp. AAP83 TaxID=1523425 RepID=UPI0006BA0874|nr:hypothetical protein [Novosphingobium sp. AAP83]